MNTEQYMALRNELAVDEHNLDHGFVRIPMLMVETMEHRIAADQIVIEKKNSLTLVCATESAEMRDELQNGKIRSEASIASELPMRELVVDARDALNEVSSDAALWAGLVDCVRAKLTAMKALSELTIAGYITPNSVYEKHKADMNVVRQRVRPIIKEI